MTADLDKLDPPLRDEPPDEADRRTQSFRSSLNRQQLVARRKMSAAHAACPVAESSPPGDQLLTVEAAAERLSTSVRFIRRLVAQRRIEFVKVGRHVRISESALAEFVAAGRVAPITSVSVWKSRRGVA